MLAHHVDVIRLRTVPVHSLLQPIGAPGPGAHTDHPADAGGRLLRTPGQRARVLPVLRVYIHVQVQLPDSLLRPVL